MNTLIKYQLFGVDYSIVDYNIASDIIIENAINNSSFGVSALATHGLITSVNNSNLKEQLKKIEKALNLKDIFPRRYFYPSLDALTYINPKQFCKISRDIASRILCLPMYAELDSADQKEIIKILKTCI